MSSRKISKEITDYDKSASPFVIRHVGSHSLRCIIFGERDTPYFGGVFWVSMEMPYDYPFKPPIVMFETKIFHPNINPNGSMDLEILWRYWSPSFGAEKILEAIRDVLREPNEHCLVNEEEYRSMSAQEYRATAAHHTRKHACPETRLTSGRIPRR
eukprot:TRINITY_DN1087_c0_g2_i1.p1 TRINITY_DN1087_c0_g2~~TRINITY_DN1087_c0_g2_i1.p1  ORF type:complete len:156 (+),score=14.38 TRINITY_DN1087_c0_g2_i1:185-652(+)